MYIENLDEYLTSLGFLEDKSQSEPEDEGGIYYKKIGETIQLMIVSTAKNWVFFISEHHIINEDPEKLFEPEYDNIKVLSECLTLEDFNYVLKKWDVI